MSGLVSVHGQSGAERSDGAEAAARPTLATTLEARARPISESEEERDDPYAFTNFSATSVVEQHPDEISPLTWIMVVIAGILLGGVLTMIASA